MDQPQQEDRPIAYFHRPGTGPTVIFLPGYASDMSGTKATALDAWARASGRAFVRFDYGGCGESGGRFEDQTFTDWRDDVLAMIDEVAEGPVVLVGSSLGGWLMLHGALQRPQRVVGLVGLAAATDFTGWSYTEEQKLAILRDGRLEIPSPYGDAPMVITRNAWQTGESLRLLHSPIPIECPVRLIHGQEDKEVPWGYSLELMKQLRSADVQTILVKDGDHRLSRERDIALLIGTIETLLETL